MKYIKVLLLGVVVFFIGLNLVDAAELTSGVSICHEEGVVKAFRILAYVITISKILIPIIIIITGVISLFKAVMSDDTSNIRKTIYTLIQKVIVGAFVFFIPTVIYGIMHFTSGFDSSSAQFSDCGKCLVSVKHCNSLLK